MGYHLIQASLGPHEFTAKYHLDRVSHFCRAHSTQSLFCTMDSPLKLPLPSQGDLGPYLVHYGTSHHSPYPNGITIGSAVYKLINVSAKQTLRQTIHAHSSEGRLQRITQLYHITLTLTISLTLTITSTLTNPNPIPNHSYPNLTPTSLYRPFTTMARHYIVGSHPNRPHYIFSNRLHLQRAVPCIQRGL